MTPATDPLAATGEQSPLRGALLALLIQGPSHCYELGNRLERQLGSDWRISRSSLYRMLKAMCAAGLLAAEKPETAGLKTVYSATRRADRAVYSWMESPLSLKEGQLQLQARMIVARLEDLPRLVVAVNNYERTLFVAHAELKAGIVNAGSLRGAMMRLVREASRHRIEAELAWLVEARETILTLLAA